MTKKERSTDANREEQIEDAAQQILAHQQEEVAEEQSGKTVGKAIGIDVGTSKIVRAERADGQAVCVSQTNAFISIEYSRFSEDILKQNKIDYIKGDKSLVVFGDGAESFANMLNKNTRRPMSRGLLNPDEENAIPIIQAIFDNLLPPAESPDDQLCFSVPGKSADTGTDIIYHEAILQRQLSSKGYQVKSINEGLAVVLSELSEENFSGLGISIGGGMCNVCLAYLSVPLLSFSLNKGGDFIDEAVSSVTREVSTRVRKVKETDLDLARSPRSAIEDALHIYHDEMIATLISTLREKIGGISRIPNLERPVPIILAGGSVLPPGFRERFEKAFYAEPFPLKVSEVRLADDPLNTTANGALIAAGYVG